MKIQNNKLFRKIIKSVASIEQNEGAGATVRRSIGTTGLKNLDPFLMLDEFKVQYPAGFPDHPHRGFETVTYMIEGSNQHEDFTGRSGIIGPGDVQWMTAGKGIVHAEMPLGNDPNEVVTGMQLWINLKAEDKMDDPNYQELKDEEIPRAKLEEGVDIKVIAGISNGIKAKIFTSNPTIFIDFKMAPNKKVTQEFPKNFDTAFAYIISGQAHFGDPSSLAKSKHTIVFDSPKQDPSRSDIESDIENYLVIETKDEPVHFVLIAGRPINEPISQYGPFVMNNMDQIKKTFRDYQLNINGFEKAEGWSSKIGRSSFN